MEEQVNSLGSNLYLIDIIDIISKVLGRDVFVGERKEIEDATEDVFEQYRGIIEAFVNDLNPTVGFKVEEEIGNLELTKYI